MASSPQVLQSIAVNPNWMDPMARELGLGPSIKQPWSNPIPTPIDASDVFRRSAARLFVLNHLEEVAARLVPHGQRHRSIYMAGNLIIALDFHVDPWFGMRLDPGMWLYDSGLWGVDLLGLYSEVHEVSYSAAASALFDAYSARIENGTQQVRTLPRWNQDLFPLHNQDVDLLVSGTPHPSDLCIFYNAAGQAVATVTKVHTTSGEVAMVWRCLWRRNGSDRSIWADIFPSEAFFMNADLMSRYQKKPVHIVRDSFAAKDPGDPNSPWILSALPSGATSLLKVDLKLLRGRRVRIDLDPSAVEEVLKIDAALMSVGVESTDYSLPGAPGLHRRVTEIVAQAEAEGFCVKNRNNDVDRGEHVVIAEPGKPIPGSDHKRETLVNPWLMERYLVWLYAPPETGKSWIASAVAQMVATGHGSIGTWMPEKRCNVLLVDGESLPDELELNRRLVSVGLQPANGTPMFEVLCARAQPSGLIDIEQADWQRRIDERLKGKQLLILDNLQSLMGNGGAHIRNVIDWFIHLTKKAVSILVLDHTNADGDLQGSIEKERRANIAISLKCVNDDDKANGIMTVSFSKWRQGPKPAPFLLQRCHEDHAVTFKVLGQSKREALAKEIPERVQRMALAKFANDDLALSLEQIKKNYGIPRSTASDLLRRIGTLEGESLRLFTAELERLRAEKMRPPDRD